MGTFYWQDAHVKLGNLDISYYVTKATLAYTSDQLDFTSMGTGGYAFQPGLSQIELDVTINMNYATPPDIDTVLWGYVNNKTSFTAECAPHQTAKAVDNPYFTFTGYLFDYQPLNATGVGNVATVDLKIKGANGSLVRTTS